MCGIAGILLDPATPQRGLQAEIAAMNRAQQHRGPDDEGRFVDAGVALGFRRLAIVDLSAAGHQPMASDDGALQLVFNGEVYNHLEIGAELQALGHRLRSRSDSEVVLRAFQQWGPECLQRFNGMFALAIWDRRQRRLFAARDRFGVKPFVHLRTRDAWLFASEVAALRAAAGPLRANPAKLRDFLAYGYRRNDGSSFFADVHELEPGHWLSWHEGRIDSGRWWQLPSEPCTLPREDRAPALRSLLADAVRLRLRADVPVALLQSGGLDSSVICTLVDDELAAGRLGASEVTAFTAVHPGQPEDESAAVKALMRRCPHVRSVAIEPEHGELARALPGFVAAMQEPQFSSTAYAHWCLMQAVRARGIKVMLNGQGADEALAGYGSLISGYRLLDQWQTDPSQAPAEAWAMHRQLGQSLPALAAQLAKAMLGRRAASQFRGWISEGALRYLRRDFHRAHADALPELPMQRGGGNLDAHLRSQLLHYGFNQILQYEDLSSMSQSIEMRSPFVDYRVMSLAMSLPDEDRFSQGITKRLLREAFASRLPPSIVHNPRKIGFATPYARWAAAPSFQAFVRELVAAPEFLRRRLWRGPQLAEVLTGRRAAPAKFPHWRFICTELWLREFAQDEL